MAVMEREPVQVARDSFARSSLMRRLVASPTHNCRWCGGKGRFEYGWEQDGLNTASRIGWSGPFCSISCYKSYNSED